MDRDISRRDFVQGAAVAVGAAASAFPAFAAEASGAAAYPPLRTGMRGDHPGSFEEAPGMKQVMGRPAEWPDPSPTGETYDLVVVGGGLSGLAAACFYRQRAGRAAKILVLDNHDDFGGHAKRNEFVHDGQVLLAPGGTIAMVAPGAWPREAIGLIETLGIDWRHPTPRGFRPSVKLVPATFFPKEAYGADRLVKGGTPLQPTPEFLARMPVSERIRKDLTELTTGTTDYFPGLTREQKIARLRAMSYRDYLLDVMKLDPAILAYTQGVWCLGNDTASAWMAYFRYKPGFGGLGVERPAGSPESPAHRAEEVYLPAGNADIARLMVRYLIPDALSPGAPAEVETRRVNYALLDRAGAPARIRLGSMAIRVRHLGPRPDPFAPDERAVEISYMKDGKAYRVTARDVVMACMNNIVPYLCPEMPQGQKRALHQAVRAANQQTNVLLRDWQAFAALGVSNITCPNAFYGRFGLAAGPMGSTGPHTPSEPVILSFGTGGNSGILSNATMVSELTGGDPPAPGTNMDDQFRAVRQGLLRTPFATFERHVRGQAARVLAGSRFDPARDILAITVNRWPHGFATGRNSLFDPTGPEDVSPTLLARQKFGRIAIANSDASGQGLTSTAISEAWRAVSELGSRTFGYYETF
jgi:spermidine dehydrogenase